MKFLLAVAVLGICVGSGFAQVDTQHRRTLAVQTGASIYQSEEALSAFGFFWFNEDRFPWTNTALRVIFAGIYADAEISYYVAGNTNTAIGAGAGGGLYVDSINPYLKGERLARQSFHGDSVGGRVFINQTIPNPTPLPLNLRGSYFVSQSDYHENSSTDKFRLPPEFATQTIQAELRFGGMAPGLLSKRGAELYLAADANYRSGFERYGPVGGPVLGHQSEYERVFGSLGAKLPVGPLAVSARLAGGYGTDIDQLSAWKLGGNLVSIEPYAYTMHGYYLRELFTDRFLLSNLALSVPVNDEHKVAVHFYGDWARARGVLPLLREYHNYFGTGAGVSFRGPWQTDFLVSYGYGINAVRNGDHGGHEIALGLERQF